jgi:hypothetical protein
MSSNTKPTSLFQTVITRLFERSSPDMLFIFNLANDIMDDPKEPALLKFGAFVVGSFTAGQGISDVVNHANGKPREWIIEPSAEVPRREKFLATLQSPPSFLFSGISSMRIPATTAVAVRKPSPRGRLKKKSISRARIMAAARRFEQ